MGDCKETSSEDRREAELQSELPLIVSECRRPVQDQARPSPRMGRGGRHKISSLAAD